MEKQVYIGIFHEFSDETTVSGIALINLSKGTLSEIDYETNQPADLLKNSKYEFSYGLLKHNGKELEFSVENNKKKGLQVPAEELEEMREKALKILNEPVSKYKM